MTAPHNYSRRGALRVALSEAARELAHYAAAVVPTDSDRSAHGGEHIETARLLLADAQDLLRLAVACEHAHGQSWAAIGEALDVSKQAAQQRFGGHVAAFERALVLLWLTGDPRGVGLPNGAANPAETARSLDDWVARQRSADDAPERAVSACLEPMSYTECVSMITAAVGLIWDLEKHPDPAVPPVAVLRYGLAKRKVEMYERMLADEIEKPGSTFNEPDKLREQLADERAQLADAAANLEEVQPPTRPA